MTLAEYYLYKNRLKEIIITIVETVEEILSRDRIILQGLVFCEENSLKLKSCMDKINTKGSICCAKKISHKELPDIIFLDTLPLKFYPKLALGIADDDFTLYLSQAFVNKKPVIVLEEKLPAVSSNYTKLLDTYRELLVSYGVKFYGVPGTPGNSVTHVPKGDSVIYKNNVLSLREMNPSLKNGTLKIDKHTVVTPSALEKAKELNIKIERLIC